MTPEVRANRYKELTENPLWREIIEYVEGEAMSHEELIYQLPKPDSGMGFFDVRAQAIGAKANLDAMKNFLLDTLSKP